MELTNALLDVLMDFLKNPPPQTEQEEFMQTFLPLYRTILRGWNAYYDGSSGVEFFRNVNYSRIRMDDLVTIRYLLNSVPSMEEAGEIEDASRYQVWMDNLLRMDNSDDDYLQLIRQIPSIRQEEVYF